MVMDEQGYQNFLEAVAKRRCPMALVPEWVIKAIERVQLLRGKARKWQSYLMGGAALLLATSAIILLLASKCPVLPEALAVVAGGTAMLAVILLIAGVQISGKYKELADQKEEPLQDFAERFMELMEALQNKSAEIMGDDSGEMIARHSKLVLKAQAQIIMRIQREHADDPLADVDAKMAFRKFHRIFDYWDLKPGPWGPYFTD